MIRFDQIPAELQRLPQWVLWRFVQKPNATKPAKLPWTIAGAAARTDDPATWTTFAAAAAAYQRDAGRTLAGVGFVFTRSDPFCGVDLDNCLAAGLVRPWALQHLGSLPSYSEISPSGTGVKIIVRGRLPGDAQGLRIGDQGADKSGALEIYAWGRFFALTGQRLQEQPAGVEDCGAALHDLYTWQRRQRESRAAAANAGPPAARARAAGSSSAGRDSEADRETRCLAYLERCPPSVSGSGGHAACYRAACETVRFDLSDAAAWRVMRWWSEQKSTPPWSERELSHKLRQAAKFIGRDRGKRLREPPAPR